MIKKKMALVAWLAIAALVLLDPVWVAPASAEAPPVGRAAAATGAFPVVQDTSCGTLLKTATSWAPAGPDAWLYQCSADAPDVWPYVAHDADLWWRGRGFVSFDTSSIPASSTVVSAVLRLSPRLVMLTDPRGTTLEIVSAAQGPTLEASDYDSVGSTSFSSQSLSALQPDQMNSLPFNSSGLTTINKGGITRLGLRLGLDLNNQAPQGGAQVVINLQGLELTVTYQEATSGPTDGPVLTRIDPNHVGADALAPTSSPLVTLWGENFRSGAAVYLMRGGHSHRLSDVDVKGSTSTQGRVPEGSPPGVYDVLFVNSDGGWAMLSGGFTVTEGSGAVTFRIYLPLLNDFPSLNSGVGP